MDKTTFIPGLAKDLSEDEMVKIKADYKKIRKFLIRQTGYGLGKRQDNESWKKFSSWTFTDFLVEVGMFEKHANVDSQIEIQKAIKRYEKAISACIKGTGAIFSKRDPCDVFTNNFNPHIMEVHEANHDLQMVVDPYACAEYVTDYLTKAEAGISKVLKAVDDEGKDLSKMQLLNKLASTLDKHREVSIQEATYRLLGLPMIKSSVIIKYVNTSHPDKRDGLLKGNLDELKDGESPFHNNIFTYYQSRPYDEFPEETTSWENLGYDIESWKNMCLADFVSCYDLIYGDKKMGDKEDSRERILSNDLGKVKLRNKRAILRYYLRFENEEEEKRGKLLLFMPFRNEMKDIHDKDIFELYDVNLQILGENEKKFSKHMEMSNIIDDIQRQRGETGTTDCLLDDDEDNADDPEVREFEHEFDQWAKKEGQKNLKHLQQFTDVIEPEELKKLVNGLNSQQRKIFDDLIEREMCRNEQKEPYYVFIAGEAGTGKSYLTRVLMEAFKAIHIKSGKELNKPSILAMAPTANAAYIIGGQTIEAALGLTGTNYNYQKLSADRESDFKFKYDEVSTIFIDEMSMVGSGKLTKINYRLQDLADGKDKKLFMGGKSCIVTGDMWQLPPVKDKYVFFNNNLDSRPRCAPSHWDENFTIFYLTEKMRSKGDPEFGDVCDRIGRGATTEKDHLYLKNLVRESPNENNNEMFKSGDINIIVTTNLKRETINNNKLGSLLPGELEYTNESVDKCTNQPNADPPPESLSYSQTKGLPKKLVLKVGAPILITVNDLKYKDDGVCNGARGFIDSFQLEEGSESKIKIIWVVFKDEKVGNRLRFDMKELKGSHFTENPKAVPIVVSKARFEINHGNLKYSRSQFPLVLGYAVTAHKSQGASLDEAIIDFTPDFVNNKLKKPYIIEGSFYVAITRARLSKNIYLKDFDPSYIRVKKEIAEKIDDMRVVKPYKFKKIYNGDQVFRIPDQEMKIGYLNINGLLDADHYIYLNHDKNWLDLDLIVLAETKLSKETDNNDLADKLFSYNIVQRFDSNDGKKHLGMLMISPKKSKFAKFDTSLLKGFLDSTNDSQGFIFGLSHIYLKLAFLYIRPGKGSKSVINNLLNDFDCDDCDVIMGDLNLNPKNDCDRQRLSQLCQDDKLKSVLNEPTTKNYTQIDHVLVHRNLLERVYATSFYNFISDHRGIVIRIGIDLNTILNEFELKTKQQFKHKNQSQSCNSASENYSPPCHRNQG